MSRWVQHKSGQGEKWEVLGQSRSRWEVKCELDMGLVYCLPKSEYVLVEPPEQWEDVTAECYGVRPSNGERGGISHCGPNTTNAVCQVYQGYRLTKLYINRWVFIVEKQVPPGRDGGPERRRG